LQTFQCPFCGRRDETEFRYVGETGRPRPAAGPADSGEWARYLYFQTNCKGLVREVWCHHACGEFFTMERDNVTHEVAASTSLGVSGRGAGPDATAAAATHDLGAT